MVPTQETNSSANTHPNPSFIGNILFIPHAAKEEASEFILCRQRLVRAITVRRILRMLAVAEPDFLLFCQREFFWTEAGAFMRAVAHGLMTGKAAGAPPVVSGFEFNGDGFTRGNFWKVRHGGMEG